MNSIYDEVDFDLESFIQPFIMAPELWRVFDINDLTDLDFDKWQTLKLLDDDENRFSDHIDLVPQDTGGIYVYCIQPSVLPLCGSYIMYIGMTADQSLRTRVKQYQRELGPRYKREKLHRMFIKWGKYVHLYFLPVSSAKETIETLEDRLIASLLPPCNPKIRIESVKRAVKAFS